MNLLRPKALLVGSEVPHDQAVVVFRDALGRSKAHRRSGILRKLLVPAIIVVFFGGILPAVLYFSWQVAAHTTSASVANTATLPFALPAEPRVVTTGALMQGSAPQVSAAAVPGEVRRIRIPKIGVDMPIVEGQNEQALLRGAWRWGPASAPDRGGNTVIFGHRYLHLPPHPETFYNLDKLVVGDTITVQWYDATYTYRVIETKVVPPTDLSVLSGTSTPTITLITCTPVFTTKNRLIVRAELVS